MKREKNSAMGSFSELGAPVPIESPSYVYIENYPNADYKDCLKWNAIDLTKIQNLLDQRLSSNGSVLSRQRAELRDAYDDTLAWANIWISHPDDDHLIDPAGPCYWELAHIRNLSLIAEGNTNPWSELSATQLTFVSVLVSASWAVVGIALQRLARRLLNRFKQATKLLFTLVKTPTFCGFSWSGRAWFLLHGSHPPKPELGAIDLMFGCV